MEKSKDKKMNFEGEKGTENVEKVAKLETLSITIKEIGHNPDSKTNPVVGYFPSGYDPLKNSDDPDSDSKSNSSVKVYRNVNFRNPRMQVVVGASGSLVDFVGTNYSGESTTPQLCNYALGVLDKETGVLKMVPIASNRIFRLEPKVRALMDANKEETTKEDDKFKILTNKYSSNRHIYRDKKLMALLHFIGEPPMEESEPIKINLKSIEATTSTATERNIPPHDVEATSPDMAYPLNKIIFKWDWKYLVDIFELVEAGSDVSPHVYPTFVCNRVHKIGAIKDEKKRKRMAGILSYITHLIKYKDRHSMDGVSSTRPHKLPSILAQRFSSLFSETEDERIRDEKQQLLISYVLVLSLFADEFRSDPSDIAKDLRMCPILLRAHYEFLGCKFSKEKVVVATLSVPLEFQTIKRKRRR